MYITDKARLVEITDNSLVLKPVNSHPGYIIDSINENGIGIRPVNNNLLSTEEITVMIFKENIVKTVFTLFKIGDTIPVILKSINKEE